MARARDIKGEKNNVIAVIGDGALTGGMALEALNDAGSSQTRLTVILNDNEMSISKNIGGVNMLLSKLRTKKTYTKSNVSMKNIINKVPIIGQPFVKIVQRLKRSIKQLIIPKMFFEDIGFRYLGPVDGHNIEELERMLNISKQLEGPVLIHVLTKKGKLFCSLFGMRTCITFLAFLSMVTDIFEDILREDIMDMRFAALRASAGITVKAHPQSR